MKLRDMSLEQIRQVIAEQKATLTDVDLVCLTLMEHERLRKAPSTQDIATRLEWPLDRAATALARALDAGLCCKYPVSKEPS